MELDFLHLLQNIHNEVLDHAMMFITSLGNGGLLWIFISIMLISIPTIKRETMEEKRKRKICGIMVLVSLAVTAILGNLIIKNIIQRPRPFQVDTSVIPLIYPREYSFPSGHTSSSFAAATTLFFYSPKRGSFAFFIAGLIAFSRMYFFVHFPTDIVGGMVLGIFCAVLVYYGQKRYFG
ncbi:MAG: phosphatase PAP2 family protein [Clostridiales bacterium]|nr:phosphatase PAP2 family protein [Clostridiales bacterium]